MKDKIKQLANDLAGEFVANRRHLHKNPELSYEEFKTQQYVAARLKEIGITPTEIANTGLVATIEGNNPSSKIVALRADMDALPIVEANDVPYKSLNQGVMHACGHAHVLCVD
eukprot:Opistho-2@34246